MIDFKRKLNINKKKPDRDNQLENPKILEVNLVKDEAIITFDWNKHILIAALTILIACGLVAEIYFGLDWWKTQEEARIEQNSEEIAKIERDAAKLKKEASDALAYKEKSTVFSELLKNHIYWTNFFSWLEKNTLSSVKYNDFTGDLSGLYSLSGTTQTFADVSWQAKSFLNDPSTKSAEIVSAQLSKSDDKTKPSFVSFNIELEVKPELFKK